jgi:hypothetical protein
MERYCRMWNELDSDPIRGHLDLAISEDCLCVDPQHAHTGGDALTVADIALYGPIHMWHIGAASVSVPTPISKLGCYNSQATPTKWVSKHKRKVISQILYVIVEDVERRYAVACSQGAIAEQVPEEQSYGGRLYLCRGFERNLCTFGDYNPWQN